MSLQDFFNRYRFNQTDSLDPQSSGSVYKATDQQTGKTVAVKSIEMHPKFDQGLLQQRFDRAMRLQHPYLLPYLATYRFEEAGLVMNYMVMAYRPLGSLRNAHPQSWKEEQKLYFLQQVLEALQYLHGRGQVWQQLTAGHILLLKDGDEVVPQCSNYGAKERIPIPFFRRYEYCAPEQFDPHLTQPDPRTDIWSFGVLCYWLFTAQYPFGQQSARFNRRQVRSRIETANRPGLIDELPDALQPILEKCFQKEVEDRWENVDALLKAWPQAKNAPSQQQVDGIWALTTDKAHLADEEPEPESENFWTRRSNYRQKKKTRSSSTSLVWWLLFLASCFTLAYLLW